MEQAVAGGVIQRRSLGGNTISQSNVTVYGDGDQSQIITPNDVDVFATSGTVKNLSLHDFDINYTGSPFPASGACFHATAGLAHSDFSNVNWQGCYYGARFDGLGAVNTIEHSSIKGAYTGIYTHSAGALYGITQFGGGLETNCPKGCGTVFKLAPEGKGFVESTIYSFAGGSDGAYPMDGLVIDKSGALYGTTQGGGNVCGGKTGCGTVFKLTPGSGGQYAENVIYRFAPNYDGVQPSSGLVVDKNGVFYGTTTKSFGLNSCDCGTVFALSPVGSTYQETTLYAFQGGVHDGSSPYAGLVLDQPDRVLYGTTTAGGASNDGTVFVIDL